MSIDISRVDSVVAHLSGPSPVADATARQRPERAPEKVEKTPEGAPSAEHLQKLADEVTANARHPLSISIHEETGRFVVKVSDGNGEILRQFPSESALGLATRLEELRGVLFEGSAA